MERTITLTQAKLDRVIAERIARLRAQYEARIAELEGELASLQREPQR